MFVHFSAPCCQNVTNCDKLMVDKLSLKYILAEIKNFLDTLKKLIKRRKRERDSESTSFEMKIEIFGILWKKMMKNVD